GLHRGQLRNLLGGFAEGQLAQTANTLRRQVEQRPRRDDVGERQRAIGQAPAPATVAEVELGIPARAIHGEQALPPRRRRALVLPTEGLREPLRLHPGRLVVLEPVGVAVYLQATWILRQPAPRLRVIPAPPLIDQLPALVVVRLFPLVLEGVV